MTEQIINDIEARVVALGCSMAALLADAGLDESTWWRWKHGKSSPTIKSLVKVQSAIRAREAATTPTRNDQTTSAGADRRHAAAS